MHNDCHVHSRGNEDVADILKAMDEGEVEKMALFSPYGDTPEKMRKSTDWMSKVQAEAPDRILGFSWIEPRCDGAAEELERAVSEKKLVGCKMIPNHWYPYDEVVFPVYEKAQELRVPIIFHSGILWGFQDSSRFCRPCFFEAMVHFPKVKFALAHISWPWTDECIATAGRFRAAAGYDMSKMQMYIDTTPGAPAFYREEALDRALKYIGAGRLIWGSDAGAKTVGKNGKHLYDREEIILGETLRRTKEEMEKIFSENLLELMKPFE